MTLAPKAPANVPRNAYVVALPSGKSTRSTKSRNRRVFSNAPIASTNPPHMPTQ